MKSLAQYLVLRRPSIGFIFVIIISEVNTSAHFMQLETCSEEQLLCSVDPTDPCPTQPSRTPWLPSRLQHAFIYMGNSHRYSGGRLGESYRGEVTIPTSYSPQKSQAKISLHFLNLLTPGNVSVVLNLCGCAIGKIIIILAYFDRKLESSQSLWHLEWLHILCFDILEIWVLPCVSNSVVCSSPQHLSCC